MIASQILVTRPKSLETTWEI